jgi:hypothetical protein
MFFIGFLSLNLDMLHAPNFNKFPVYQVLVTIFFPLQAALIVSESNPHQNGREEVKDF